MIANPGSEQYLIDKIRKIDPDATFVDHPTLLYAYLCKPSKPEFVGPLVAVVDLSRPIGIIIEYDINNHGYVPHILLSIEKKKLNLWQRFLRRMA